MIFAMLALGKVPTERQKSTVEMVESRSMQEMLLRGIPWLRRVVTGYPFELFFVSLILLNCISMMVQIELFGLALATTLGIQTGTTSEYGEVFFLIELGFGFVFSAEILIKFFAFGLLDFWKFGWNLLDLFIAHAPDLSCSPSYILGKACIF